LIACYNPAVQSVATAGASCLNCGAALDGPFCAQCGQKAVPPTPRLHELAHDGLEEFLHFDGKIVQTLRTLITRPGQLTVDMVAGRRARYIAPLRLYLTVSLVYFLLAAATPSGLKISVTSNEGVKTTIVGAGALSEADRRVLLDAEAKTSPILRPLVHRVREDPAGLQRDVFAAWPKALFVLLPAFALIVAAFHWRRHFVEHMYFAFHIHAFAFLIMAVNAAIALAHAPWLSIPAGVAVLVWILIYAHLAFRRVYGDSHAVTVLKETGVALLYGIASVPVMLVVALWAASHPH
jgi:hypothetical protein